MSEISNVLVYALKIKYNYILSLYFKTCTKGLKGGGGAVWWTKEKTGGGVIISTLL